MYYSQRLPFLLDGIASSCSGQTSGCHRWHLYFLYIPCPIFQKDIFYSMFRLCPAHINFTTSTAAFILTTIIFCLDYCGGFLTGRLLPHLLSFLFPQSTQDDPGNRQPLHAISLIKAAVAPHCHAVGNNLHDPLCHPVTCEPISCSLSNHTGVLAMPGIFLP